MKNTAADIFARIGAKVASPAISPVRDAARGIRESIGFAVVEPADVGPPGLTLRVQWDGALGATKAEVDRASIALTASVLDEPMQDAMFEARDGGFAISVPAGKRVKAIRVEKLGTKDDAGNDVFLASQGDFSKSRRLSISAYEGSKPGAPIYAIPSVGSRGQLPSSLRGASMSDSVIELPEPGLDARKMRVSIVDGEFQEDFSEKRIQLARASVRTYAWTRDLTLRGPDGAVLWAMPGEWNPEAPSAEIDLRAPLKIAIESSLANRSDAPIDLPLTLKASNASRVSVRMSSVRGSLVRTFAGVKRVVVAGEPVVFPLVSAGEPGLATETPGSVIADVAIRYDGLRVLTYASDDPIDASEQASGVVVGDEQVFRALHPDVGMQLSKGRIGLIGRAGETCELAVQVCEQKAGQAPSPLADPTVLSLEPDLTLRTRWIDLPELRSSDARLVLGVRANSGRFLWAMREAPLLRIAVRDPDPGGRSLLLAGREAFTVGEAQSSAAGFALSSSAFAGGGVAPMIESELFLTLDFSDLTLRYSR